MKIAILQEMLVKLGGAEKIIEKLLYIFKDADLFTLIYDEAKVGNIFPKERINKQVFSLKTQKIYNLFKNQRLCLLYMAGAVEELDFSNYDVVIACSSGFAHGAITKPETKFIVYYNSPSRYLWDRTNEYKNDIGRNKGIKGLILNKVFLKLRQWDFIASNRNNLALANSKNTKSRIEKYYRKDALIMYPPVETGKFAKEINKPENLKIKYKKYYIIISALTEFKKIDIAVKAFKELVDSNLLIIGGGNYKENLEKIKGSAENIEFIGAKFGEELVYLVQKSSGLIFPGEEDFGIVPIETMSAGLPIFALKKGGLKESIIEGITGDFFTESDGKDFIEKFLEFDKKNKEGFYKKQDCINQAKNFDENIFEENIKNIVYSK